MKNVLLSAVLAVSVMCGFAQAKGSSHSSGNVVHVKSYKKKNGENVKAHDRTAPNNTKKDNWSTKGNTNPETGKPGTKPAN